MAALLREYPISFLKWDHNRDLVDTAHDGRHAVHGQTTAFYRLLDLLRAEHPGLEVESCASGGGRVDAGVLQRTDRIWPSDTIDALERQHIQRWTGLLVPPEIMGAHVGSPEAHTTGRSHRLDFRAATALLGHFGIEWDLTRASDEERRGLAEWVSLYKRVRHVVGSGTLVRGDHPDPALLLTGVVSPDRDEAVFVVATVASMGTQTPLPVRLPGLDGRAQVLRPAGRAARWSSPHGLREECSRGRGADPAGSGAGRGGGAAAGAGAGERVGARGARRVT